MKQGKNFTLIIQAIIALKKQSTTCSCTVLKKVKKFIVVSIQSAAKGRFFCYEENRPKPQSAIKPPMRKSFRLQLLFSLHLRRLPDVLPSLLSTSVETDASPSQKTSATCLLTGKSFCLTVFAYAACCSFVQTGILLRFIKFLVVEMAGIEPASRSPSL